MRYHRGEDKQKLPIHFAAVNFSFFLILSIANSNFDLFKCLYLYRRELSLDKTVIRKVG